MSGCAASEHQKESATLHPQDRLPIIGKSSDKGSPAGLRRGFGSPGHASIPTRVKTAQLSSSVSYNGEAVLDPKPMTSPVNSDYVRSAHGAWTKESAIPPQFKRTVCAPLIPPNAKSDMSNIEFTGSSFVTTEFPTRRPVERIETVQLNALLDQMVKKVREDTNQSQSDLLERLREVHDLVSGEVARQVSVHCLDQGLLVERCLHFYSEQAREPYP